MRFWQSISATTDTIAAICSYMPFMNLTDGDMRNIVATIDIATVGQAAPRVGSDPSETWFDDPSSYEALMNHLYPPVGQRSAELICDIVRVYGPQVGRPQERGPLGQTHWTGLRSALAVGDVSLVRRHMRGLWGRLEAMA